MLINERLERKVGKKSKMLINGRVEPNVGVLRTCVNSQAKLIF